MRKNTKWIAAALIALSLLSAASIALANTIYFPVMWKGPTVTPTPTATMTPTVTATPTITPTPQPGVVIVYIEADPSGPDIESEFVTIENRTNRGVNMSDWTLADTANIQYQFPDGFTLRAGREVDVWSKDGVDTDRDLYWGRSSPVWDNFSDCAYLYDDDDDLVHQLCYERAP